jgi:hypothetical protein
MHGTTRIIATLDEDDANEVDLTSLDMRHPAPPSGRDSVCRTPSCSRASVSDSAVGLIRRGRRRSLFIPPGFAGNDLETYTDEQSGVTFLAGHDSFSSHQPPKVLKYDARKLLSGLGTWRALRSQTRDATVLYGTGLGVKLPLFTAISAAFCTLGPFLESDIDEAAGALNLLIAGGLFFLLGPYVGTSVSRWWSVRKECIGGLWGTVDDLSSYAAAWFSSRSAADMEARALVLRLGLASHALLYKQARGEDSELADLVSAGLLRNDEAAALAPLPSKAQVVWTWMTAFWTKALGGSLALTPPPHAAQLMPLVMDKCMKGRGAIGSALCFIDTQQPFVYLHLLALITDVALGVNAMAVGLHTGRQLASTAHCRHQQTPNIGEGDAEALCRAAIFSESPINLALLIGLAAVRVAAFTFIYNGLLGIGVALDNPLGDDPCDLPGLAFQVGMRRAMLVGRLR